MTGIGNRTEEGLALEQSARLRMELPGASLRGVGLFGANLSYVWFQNADLSYAYLYVANLSFANFLGANFRVREPSRLRKKGKALSRSVWSLNCLGGIRHVIGQFE